MVNLFSWLAEILSPIQKVVIPTPKPIPAPVEPPKPVSKIPPWVELATALQGTAEIPGPKSNPTIVSWAKLLDDKTKKSYTEDDIPWCGLFVGFCLKKTGYPEDDSPLWAKSWANYGQKLDTPAYGCIMVFSRDGGGHVGFYISEDDTYYHILGGNQSNAVNVTKVAKSRCIAYRWPQGAAPYLKVGRIKKAFVGKVSTNEA